MPKKICIILARGGSKRIPKKNIRLFHGYPIVSYPIKIAIESNIFDRVIVSTDSQRIKDIAEEWGAEVPFLRSHENSVDSATTMDALRETCEKIGVKSTDYVLCMYGTSVFSTKEDILRGFELLQEENCKNVFSAIEYSYPIWRSGTIEKNDYFKMLYPKYVNYNSQDLESVYHDSGQWYWWKASEISADILNKNTRVIIVDNFNAHDIDNNRDWQEAEIKYQLKSDE
jgi:N-acylneuraminate cytidylyltransferase